MPLFVAVSVLQNEHGVIPEYRVEVDHKTVSGQSHPLFVDQHYPDLGMGLEVVKPQFVGHGHSGYVSPSEGEGMNQAIWWAIEDGRLYVRVGYRLITFGLNYINQPDQPTP